MATITKTKLWKKMAVQADKLAVQADKLVVQAEKLKTEVKKLNKHGASRSPSPQHPQQDDGIYSFASESPHHAAKSHKHATNYEDMDEGVYEDFSSSSNSEQSYADEKYASAEDLPQRLNAQHNQQQLQINGNRLHLPRNALHHELKDFHLKTASLPRNVKALSNRQLQTPAQPLQNARSVENLSQPKKKALTPKHMAKTQQHRYLRENTYPSAHESGMVDNVLYNPAMSDAADDAFAGAYESYDAYGMEKRNPLYSTSSNCSAPDERAVGQSRTAPSSPSLPTQQRFKYKVDPDAHVAGLGHRYAQTAVDDFADEPVFGTIEPRYARTYELSAADYSHMNDHSVYNEPGNFYDFE